MDDICEHAYKYKGNKENIKEANKLIFSEKKFLFIL